MLKLQFVITNYELDSPLPKGKKKVIGLMKDELGRKIIIKFAKGIKKCVIQRKLKLENA